MAQESLFAPDPSSEPLAARMRPQTLDEFVGQDHVLGPGRLLRRAIQADMLSSVIFYGPPGTGKTTLARVIANTTRGRFLSLNAVLAGVKDVRESIVTARENRDLHGRKTILFVDEVHRWNKAQQDALLPWVENGTVVLIGATTQNPFFEVNSALVSRSRIFQLKRLTEDDLRQVVRRALCDRELGYGRYRVRLDDDALEHLLRVAEGDARALLNAVQLAVETTPERFPPPDDAEIHITREIAEDSIQRKAVLYDKEGDYHYDVASAFIKSIRGSDPDAALYWMAKMVHGGEDPHFIFRRMLISASEDIGLADPQALGVVAAAAASFDRVGLPEGNFHLAQAALYLATAPKSNSALGYFDALEAVASEPDPDVPNHLRDASRDREGFGHGAGYLYPHAYRDHWVAQTYLPAALRGRLFYQPSEQGYEASIAVRVARLRELQLEAALPEQSVEVLSYGRSADRRMREWVRRTADDRTAAAALLREAVAAEASVARHHRVLVSGRSALVHFFEATRAAPEGSVVAVITDRDRAELARRHVSALPELERPRVVDGTIDRPGERLEPGFEVAILADALLTRSEQQTAPEHVVALLAERGRLVVVQRVPALGQRLSTLASLPEDAATALAGAEEALYRDAASELTGWTVADLVESLARARLVVTGERSIEVVEQRYLAGEQLDAWLDAGRATGLGPLIVKQADAGTLDRIRSLLRERLADRTVEWRSVHALISARR